MTIIIEHEDNLELWLFISQCKAYYMALQPY